MQRSKHTHRIQAASAVVGAVVGFILATSALFGSLNPLARPGEAMNPSDSAPLDTIVGSVPIRGLVGGGPIDVADNAYIVLTFCFVCASDSIVIFSTITHKVVASIPIGFWDTGQTLDPATGDLYISSLTGEIQVVSVPSRQVVAHLFAGRWAWPGVYDPFNGDIYLPSLVNQTGDHGEVVVISGSNHTLLSEPRVGGAPWAAAVDYSNGDVYVSNADTGNISVIDNASNSVIASIPVNGTPGQPVYDPANQLLYVALLETANQTDPDTIQVINTSTNSVVASIRTVGPPATPIYDPATGELFVPCSWNLSISNRLGYIMVVNGTTNLVVNTFRDRNAFSDSALYVPSDRRLYLADTNSGNLTILKSDGGGVLEHRGFGNISGGLSYDPVRGELLTTDFVDERILVLGPLPSTNGLVGGGSLIAAGLLIATAVLLIAAVYRRSRTLPDWTPSEEP